MRLVIAGLLHRPSATCIKHARTHTTHTCRTHTPTLARTYARTHARTHAHTSNTHTNTHERTHAQAKHTQTHTDWCMGVRRPPSGEVIRTSDFQSKEPGFGSFDAVIALTFFGRYKRSDWRFCACAIYEKSSMCSEKTKHLWHKYYGLFVRMYIIFQQSYLSQINTMQTSFEVYFDSKRKSRDCSAP